MSHRRRSGGWSRAATGPSLLVLTLGTACFGGLPPPCGDEFTFDCAPDGESPTLSCAPQTWWEGGVEPERLGPFRELRCFFDRTAVLAGPGSAEISAEELQAFVWEASPLLFERVPGVTVVGFGLCCFDPASTIEGNCLVVELDRCSTPVDELLAEVTAIARELDLEDRELQVSVTATGRFEPRCDPAAETCEPEPYDGASYCPTSRRYPVSEGRGDACGHDGDCIVSGCGNGCESWVNTSLPGTCEYRGELTWAHCGCVDGECGWFNQLLCF